jgi:hypothetical protein
MAETISYRDAAFATLHRQLRQPPTTEMGSTIPRNLRSAERRGTRPSARCRVVLMGAEMTTKTINPHWGSPGALLGPSCAVQPEASTLRCAWRSKGCARSGLSSSTHARARRWPYDG